MRMIALIIMVVSIFSSVTPCYTANHEHKTACHHHEHDDSTNDSRQDNEHPCSPFCAHHSSLFNVKEISTLSIPIFISDLKKTYLFNYRSLESELYDKSFWNPPRV